MSVKCNDSDLTKRKTMEEVCQESKFDSANMTESEHLEELCMVAAYLSDTLRHYVKEINSRQILGQSTEVSVP